MKNENKLAVIALPTPDGDVILTDTDVTVLFQDREIYIPADYNEEFESFNWDLESPVRHTYGLLKRYAYDGQKGTEEMAAVLDIPLFYETEFTAAVNAFAKAENRDGEYEALLRVLDITTEEKGGKWYMEIIREMHRGAGTLVIYNSKTVSDKDVLLFTDYYFGQLAEYYVAVVKETDIGKIKTVKDAIDLQITDGFHTTIADCLHRNNNDLHNEIRKAAEVTKETPVFVYEIESEITTVNYRIA